MENHEEAIEIEVVYALPEQQTLCKLRLPLRSTVREAIEISGILNMYPEIDFSRNKLGVFGKLVEPDRELRAGDRVEIYRPLARDPKEIRRERARQRRDTAG
jgi:hypothetical protein